ncbi:MAG: hypothetical protein AABZ13_02665, partial [Planctomycetota bacterium]
RPVAPVDPLKWIKNTSKEGLSDKVKPESPLKTYSAPQSPYTNEPAVRKDDVVLRQETLIISAIAATFLSIACFFVGYKVGYNKGAGLLEGGEEEQWMETVAPPAQKKVEHAPAKVAEVPQKPASKPAPQKVEKPAEPAPVKAVEPPQKSAGKPVPQKVEKPVEPPKPATKDSWTLRVVSYKNTRENVEKAKEVAKVIYDKLGLDAFVVSGEKDIFVCVGEYEGSDSSGLTHAQKALSELVYENKKQFEGCYPVRMR